MARRGIRILLILGLGAAAGLTGWQIWSLEGTRREQRTNAERLQGATLRLNQAILDIRASQRAYLSPGQGLGFWKPRVDTQLLALRDELQGLKIAASAAAAPFDDTALEALTEATRLERRMAEHVQGGRLPHAADLMYADNVRTGLTLERAVDAALAAHGQDLAAQQTETHGRELLILGSSALIGAFLGMLLAFGRGLETVATDTPTAVSAARRETPAAGRRETRGDLPGPNRPPNRAPNRTPSSAPNSSPNPGANPRLAGPSHGSRPSEAGLGSASSELDLPMRPDVDMRADRGHDRSADRNAERNADRGADRGSDMRADPRAGRGGAPPPDSAPDGHAAAAAAALRAAADLCVSMARVGDADGLQPLLARLADQLDAVGLIVWLEDADGRSLRPAMTHGYAADALARLQAIDRDDDNAAACAFRLAEPQIVAGHTSASASSSSSTSTDSSGGQGTAADRPGAIVVPMLTAAGCVGVISAEVRHGREHDPATLALARIVAAQLATLTGPTPATTT